MRAWVGAALSAGALLLAGCTSATDGSGATGSSSIPPSPTPTPTSTPAGPLSSPRLVTVTATATVTRPPTGSGTTPAETGPVSVPAGFVGTWYGHSRDLVITRDGAVTMSFRLYVNCTATRTTGCDRISGNDIIAGGSVRAHVSQVINSTTVIMDVTSSTVPADVPLGSVRLGHDLTHHAVALFAGALSGAPFCGTGSPDGYCGA